MLFLLFDSKELKPLKPLFEKVSPRLTHSVPLLSRRFFAREKTSIKFDR
jgi:hypothetical protein